MMGLYFIVVIMGFLCILSISMMECNNFFTCVFCVDFDKLMNVLPFRNMMFSGISDSVVTVEIY